MEFVFDTVYDQKALTAMARGLRKTIRKKHNRRSRIFGWFVILFILLLTIPLDGAPLVVEGRTVITWAVGAMILVALLFEDKLNAWFACRRMMPGTDHAAGVFTEENYSSETAAGTTQWKYDNIRELAEDNNYFIFVLDQRYAQVYDKRTLSGGSAEEFGRFIRRKTGKEIQRI